MSEVWKQYEGQVIQGEFRLLQYLGGNERSGVFRTERSAPQPQKAAIKFIPADPANAQLQLSRWSLAAKLSHPHLVRIFQVGRCQLGDQPLLFILMEFAEEDLSQILPTRSLTPIEARAMLAPALDALAYIHAQGFAHGHIKPANVMAHDDYIKISSDALCRLGESSRGPRKPCVYDPPEISSAGPSPAGDVWSLGMTLVEALTQRLPVWDASQRQEPVLPQAVPAPFLDIARLCLRRDPQLRCSIADIMARLHQPQTPRPAATPARSQIRKPSKPEALPPKWRSVLPAVAIALALAALLAGPRLLRSRHPSRTSPVAPLVQPGVPPKSENIPATSPTGQPTQITSDNHQVSSGTAPPPPSAKSTEVNMSRSSGLVRGEVLDQVLPDVSQKARDSIQGTVRVSVKVRVDPSGSVAEATLDSPGPSKYFADLAVHAAQRWTFSPPNVDGKDVPSEWILRFQFDSTATRVHPVQTVP